MIRGEWKKKEEVDDDDNDIQSDNGTAEEHEIEEPSHNVHVAEKSEDLDALADSMTSLSLVPDAIRFGRGGKGGGFPHPPSSQLRFD